MIETVTLQVAQELLDAGFPQNSCHFVWGYSMDGEKVYPKETTIFGDSVGRIADAPTGEEILSLIQVYDDLSIWITYSSGRWWVSIVDWMHEQGNFNEDRLVDAAAKAWLTGRKANELTSYKQ